MVHGTFVYMCQSNSQTQKRLKVAYENWYTIAEFLNIMLKAAY